MVPIRFRQGLLAAVMAGSVGALGWGGFSMRQAAGEQIAVTGRPAMLVPDAPKAAETAGQPSRVFVVVTMTGYRPPTSGRVEVVVNALDRSGTARREIGRFVIFPNEPFTSRGAGDRRMDRFEIKGCAPADAVSCAGRIEVEVLPLSGSGAGAQVTLGGAEIELR